MVSPHPTKEGDERYSAKMDETKMDETKNAGLNTAKKNGMCWQGTA